VDGPRNERVFTLQDLYSMQQQAEEAARAAQTEESEFQHRRKEMQRGQSVEQFQAEQEFQGKAGTALAPIPLRITPPPMGD
jgi:hypothetical protein